MRAAEELLLNAKVYGVKGGHYIHDDGTRCAVGCLLPEDADGGVWSTMKAVRKKYPWMVAEKGEVRCPYCSEFRQNVMDAVSHIFDIHVFLTHDATLEELAAWIDEQDHTPRTPAAELGALMDWVRDGTSPPQIDADVRGSKS